MNRYAIRHTVESSDCFPIGSNDIVLRLRIDKNDYPDKIWVVYGVKYKFHDCRNQMQMEMLLEDGEYRYYEARIHLKDRRLAYVFRIEENEKEYYFSSDGLTENYDFDLAYYNFFQIAYINDADIMHEVSWAKDAVVYEIFVDRFFRPVCENEDYINLKWGDIPNPHSFAGGNIQGIIDKLPYLKDLGVNTLYLTPIFESISNHKYDISDYYEIAKHFGTKELLKKLVDTCHQLGFHIVLDAVFNHVSSLAKQFQDVVERGKNSPYFDWFIIYGDHIEKPANYEVFSVCEYMPKLNTSNPEVQEYLCDIGCYYVKEFGIDGWRLDVSDEVSHAFWRKFRLKIKAINPDCLLIGENWQDGMKYLEGDQFDGIMNYSFMRYMNDFFAFHVIDAQGFVDKMNGLLVRYTDPILSMSWMMLDSHDTYRFYTQVKKNKELSLIGTAVQMFFMGMPCIYYGDEIPLVGGYDPDCRRCMPWEQATTKNEYFKKFRELIHVRKDYSCIRYGKLTLNNENGVISLIRSNEERRITLYINQSSREQKLRLEGNELVSNLYKNEILQMNGLVIVEEKLK